MLVMKHEIKNWPLANSADEYEKYEQSHDHIYCKICQNLKQILWTCIYFKSKTVWPFTDCSHQQLIQNYII